MSSRSRGGVNKKKQSVNNQSGPAMGSSADGDKQFSSLDRDRKFEEDKESHRPLESLLIEISGDNGSIKLVPALDKRWVPSMNYIEFYLPSSKTIVEDEVALFTWLDYMDMYCKDLKWLLSVPHHQFWSVIVHSPEVPQLVLQSFLLRAPQLFDKEFQFYIEHEIIGPKYQEIYSLVFRVFMRLCTHKESKKDFITPVTWANLIADHQILDVLKLQSVCCLYDSENNPVLSKMIENVMKNSPKLTACYRNLIPVLLSKTEEMTDELQKQIRESSSTNDWNPEIYEDILSFFLSTTCGLYKFAKVYTPAAETILRFPNALVKLAATYEPNCCKVWSKVTNHLPDLEDRVILLRTLLIRLFRVSLAYSTINQVNTSNDQKIDEFFDVLTNCLDEKIFICDYEKTYPFKQDMHALFSRGVFIDDTRIDYMANAISACFNACGEEYALEKIVVDPLYDPNFDRQLLGACSLDVTGVELESLVTQVKDILPELSDAYIEVVLKHYGYQPEVAINALLEGSVPIRLEKYKNDSYVQPLNNSIGFVTSDEIVTGDSELENRVSKLKIKDADFEENFYAGKKRQINFNTTKAEMSMSSKEKEDLKPIIKSIMAKMQTAPEPDRRERDMKGKKNVKISTVETKQESYIDESLLPSFRESLEYEDEYDDTYDELGVGMTEPDMVECKPLNQKMQHYTVEDFEEEEPSSDKKNVDQLYEDPAIVRARMEHRRNEKMQHRRRGPPPPAGDVVGRAKGQGQEKDVVYARLQKTVNKDPGGYKKKRADFKRKEF